MTPCHCGGLRCGEIGAGLFWRVRWSGCYQVIGRDPASSPVMESMCHEAAHQFAALLNAGLPIADVCILLAGPAPVEAEP